MAKNFRFISQDYSILDELEMNRSGGFYVREFVFQLVTPKGNIMELSASPFEAKGAMSLKSVLTYLVLRQAPHWYAKYIDIFPVKVIKLRVYKEKYRTN